MTRVAVVGHIEWVEFVRVPRYPERGGLEQGERELEGAGGGAVVAAAMLAQLGAEVDLLCAPGDDERGHAAVDQLRARGVRVHPVFRSAPTRYVFTLLDEGGERTIITVGERLAPAGDDDLGWDLLASADGVYVTAADATAMRAARAARVMTISPRAGGPVDGLTIDAVILSVSDEDERRWAEPWESHTMLMVGTEGAKGGRWWGASQGRWEASPPPGPIRDSYGAGDSFAAAFTFGLAEGRSIAEAARLGARVGAELLTRVGAP